MKKLYYYLRYRYLLYHWRRRERKRRRSNIRIGNINAFFAALEEAGINYLVLRWFDELPKNLEEEKNYHGDIDMLAESSQLGLLCKTLARFPGRIKVDLYSNSIRLGTDCKRIAYYPPLLGSELLASTMFYQGRFRCPQPRLHLYSLLYHCVYQKGLLCGLPSGTALPNHESYAHDLPAELQRLAQEAGEDLPQPLNLLNIHHWLQKKDWSMPYDLMGRWPKRNAWHEELLTYETKKLLDELQGLRQLLVFLLREDAKLCGADKQIVEKLGEKFHILETVQLDGEKQSRVMRQTRGGDWTKHKHSIIVPPVSAVICHDPNPSPISENLELAAAHTFVDNANVFYKHEFSKNLEKQFPQAINFMHGSDNDPESMAYIKAIYPENWQTKIAQWKQILQPSLQP